MNIPIPPRDPNSKPNPEFVAALQYGLTRLWDGCVGEYGYEYICVTLQENDTISDQLRDIIEDRLFDPRRCVTTYRKWAMSISGKSFNHVEIQAGRKAWMLDLIAEFS